MATIKKKIWPKNFTAIQAGGKTCELRLADQTYAEGDTLILKEWDPVTKSYTGREITKRITHVGETFRPEELPWSFEEIKQHGLVLLSIE